MEAYNITITTDFDSQTGATDISAESSLLLVTIHDWNGDLLEGIKATLESYQDELDTLVDSSLPLD